MSQFIRNALLQKLADHYEERADELTEFARRYGHLQSVNIGNVNSMAAAMHEAAAYARQQKD